MKAEKRHFRFDYARDAWRESSPNGYVNLRWLFTCVDCGNQRLAASVRNPRCDSCRVERREIFSKAGRKAHATVYRAIMAGKLPQLDGTVQCADCNAAAQVYDHRDYSKPLEVDPVCRVCNHLRGSTIDAPLPREKVFKNRRTNLHLVRA